MRETQKELGFEGTLQEYFTWLRTDPRFKRKTVQEKIDAFNRISKMVEAKAPQYFSKLPTLPLEVRPVEPFREKYAAEASYNDGSPDGSRPGVFYYSTYDLPARTTPNEITLYLHEAEPGHHFQISLAMENEALPNFMRFGGNTAFVEGWALYAETLGYDMGFYDDPASRFGTLNDEMLRAMRLVVDTGLHAKGWTREQAIKYMTDNSALGREDIRAEVERYIALPGQALAYKIGALTIQRLRAKAEKALGDGLRHPRIPRTGARDRFAAAAGARSQDRRLDRREEGIGEDARALLWSALGSFRSDQQVGGDRSGAVREFSVGDERSRSAPRGRSPPLGSPPHGLTGRSCSRLFDPTVTDNARTIPGSARSRTLASPGGVSIELCGIPFACAVADVARSRPAAAPAVVR